MPQMVNGVELLTVGEVAWRLGITRKKVLEWSWNGGVPWPEVCEPGNWRWKAEDFEGLWQ